MILFKMQPVRCIICNNTLHRKLKFLKIISRYKTESYPLLKCSKCGLVRPDKDSIIKMLKVKIYDDPKNIKFYNLRKSEIDSKTHAYKDYFRHFRIYKQLANKYSIKGKGLDIGCGAGHLIKTLSSQSLQMQGYEVSKPLLSALKKEGFIVHSGSLNKRNIKQVYDIITFNQVLEHIENPVEFIRNIKPMLKSGSLIIFAVPYLKGFVPQVLRSYWYGLGYGQHFNFFSKESLKILLEEQGFEICEYRLLISDYTYEKFPKVMNLIIRAISSILVKLNLGDSLLVVARKK